MVWLKVECPHDGSVKSLCTHFFRAVDDALDTDYERLYFKSSSSAERMLADIARVAALHSLGLLVLDEVQHLEKSRSGGADKILNFFVTLTNVIKVPVLFIGTPKALDLFKPTMRSARRASQFGSLDWERFSCVQQGNAPSEWKHFFKRLWKLQWLSSPTPYSEDMNELFWDLTQGIAHIAVALFYLSQTRAVTAMKTPILSEELVIKTYNEELSLIHPMVMALRSENPERIKEYADLDVPIEAIRLKATAPLAMPEALTVEEERASEEAKEPSTFQRLSSILANFGIGEDIIPAIASQAIEENPDADIWTLVEHVKRLEDPQKGNAEKKAPASDKAKVKALQPRYTENDLRLMRQNDAEKSYQHFKKKGVIIDFLAYL
ncbi:ATP-binding protein [Vreelandella arctica]|uniref:ATP-binding protein n=1 Tax=Vreelandella arctica TaxID=3126499 RepID=UPI00300DBE98